MQGVPHSAASDVWALGLIALECVTRAVPWAEVRDPVVNINLVSESAKNLPLNLSEDCPAVLRQFIEACLQRKPELRPTAVDMCLLLKNVDGNGCAALQASYVAGSLNDTGPGGVSAPVSRIPGAALAPAGVFVAEQREQQVLRQRQQQQQVLRQEQEAQQQVLRQQHEAQQQRAHQQAQQQARLEQQARAFSAMQLNSVQNYAPRMQAASSGAHFSGQVHQSSGSANGRALQVGARGGTFYINGNGNKTYVKK